MLAPDDVYDVSDLVKADAERILSAERSTPPIPISGVKSNVVECDSDFLVRGEGTHSLPPPPPSSSKRSSSSPLSLCASPPWRTCRSIFHGFFTTALIVAVLSLSLLHADDEIIIQEEEREVAKLEHKSLPPSGKTLQSLAFGSCSDQRYPQPFWDTVANDSPDLFVMMGDNVYGNCESESSCNNLLEAYERLAAHPSFVGAQQLLPIVATLDDHDYGATDADGSNVHKDLALHAFHNFWHGGLRKGDVRAGRSGAYDSYMYGRHNERVQLILLDTRYDRDAFVPTDELGARGKENYVEYIGPSAEEGGKRILSEQQWSWLEMKLKEPATVRVLVSSIQVIADGHGFECWRMIPQERNRLYSLLRSTSGTTVIISGDRHLGAVYHYEDHAEHVNITDSGGGRLRSLDQSKTTPWSVYEITSSSLTHTCKLSLFICLKCFQI
uniref:PhoD-like phosphatase metallophosphatase domain-containing protein n=1 Tax=Corethron hystrix TaxID=216773 RepID=A0A7S1BC01_9STRA|mmetsp:Transcript_20418/g.46358  ORF Transcript_20418/g.46358 Transcript_20418/m.46358 type:complete len:441 (+) Transcript_20418:182-1504(+)